MSQLPRKRFFYLTSGNLLNESTNTFQAVIQLPDYQDFDRISLTQASIPISYYVVQQGFNTFNLIEGNSTILITLVPANYNALSFATIVSGLMTAASLNSLTYTITYPSSFTAPQTGKFTYTVNSSGISVSMAYPQKSSISAQFGFNTGSTVSFIRGSGSSTLVSANVINFIPENTLLIHSNLVQDEYTDVLQEIYSFNSAPFQNLTFLNPDPLAYSKRLSSNKLQSVTFSITDEFSNPVYLNGLDMVLTIMIYKDSDYYAKSEKFMKHELRKEIEAANKS